MIVSLVKGLYSFITDFILKINPWSLVVISPFLDEKSAQFLIDLPKINKNHIIIYVYTRAPGRGRTSPSHDKAVKMLCGVNRANFRVAVDTKGELHRKNIYINGMIKITGSLNFASWSDQKEEDIQIFVDPLYKKYVLDIISDIISRVRVSVVESDEILADLQKDMYMFIRTLWSNLDVCSKL